MYIYLVSCGEFVDSALHLRAALENALYDDVRKDTDGAERRVIVVATDKSRCGVDVRAVISHR